MSNFTLTGTINHALNYTANFVETIQLHKTIPSMALGGIGGYLVGIGPGLGIVQGLASSLCHSWIIRPITKYVEKQEGTGPDNIHPNTVKMLSVAGVIVEIAGPVLFTILCGAKILASTIPYMPKMIKSLLESQGKNGYTFMYGLSCSIAPYVAQYSIEWCREENKKAKES